MINTPAATLCSNASTVRCHGRTRAQIRNARIARYGHWKAHWIAPPAAGWFFRGFGRSRTFGASRATWGLERCPVAARRPISSRSSAHERLEADDHVPEAPARGPDDDLLTLRRSHQRPPQRGRRGHGASTGRLLLAVLGQEIGLLLVLVVERADGDQHVRHDRVRRHRRLDDLRIAERLLEPPDLRLHQALGVLGGVVLGVLADVTVFASHLE